jgi:hypothetical protein
MRLHAALFLLASLVASTLAIFADEAYHVDHHYALLGTPRAQTTFFHKPSSSSNASLLYTLSEKLVLGAVNPKDGSIVWRQNLAGYWRVTEAEPFLRAVDGEDVVITALGGDVSSWGAMDGKLSWASQFNDGPVKDLELVELEEGNSRKLVKDSIVLFGRENGIVRRLDGELGSVKWEYMDSRCVNSVLT